MKALAQSWIGGLSSRERLLLAAAATLVLVLGATSFVVTPLRATHERARLDYAGSALDLAEARQAAELAASRTAAARVVPAGDMRAAVTSAALSRGLAITRMTPVDRGGLAVRLDRADPAVLYAWLADLEASQAVTVRRASLRRIAGTTQLEADVVLSPSTSGAGGGA
jgi:type II secretory pathway component PulM